MTDAEGEDVKTGVVEGDDSPKKAELFELVKLEQRRLDLTEQRNKLGEEIVRA